jgi:hypothetical protein
MQPEGKRGDGSKDGSKSGSKNGLKGPTSKKSLVVAKAGTVVAALPAIWDSGVLQQAGQVLNQITGLGQTLPFVAPAFVILKIIIDIETRAREADAKCNDLLERITFMLGHLPVLKRIEVLDATRRVIENMNNVLKKSAALIEAYRKQGAIARRLHMGYRDKFADCAESINKTASDLMMSLQIHQSSQLDILTRKIPVDPEDEAAEKFIAAHGGADAVKAEPQLVSQFAREQHLTMDEESMEQLNSNITNIMQQNQAQLERTLVENVSTAVMDSFKELAAQMKEADKEQVFQCVQCDKEFRNSMNTPTACSFHRAEYSSWNKSYPCCSTAHPCQFQSHRAVHHCDYPYGSFFPRARNILQYVDTVEEWASVEDTNLENDKVQKASVGRLLRWVSQGARLEASTILITVGSVWYTEPYFFDAFTSSDLEVAMNLYGLTRKTLIFRTSPSIEQYAMAEWVVSEGVITGIRLTAKEATSLRPHVQICSIDATACSKSGETATISEGGFHAYNPQSPYVIPKTIRISPELSDKPLRAVRTDFKTRTSPNLPLILKATSEPPLKANVQFARDDADNFEGVVSVFNKHPSNSSNSISIASVSASFRLVGDKDYQPVQSLKVTGKDQLPVTIEPRQSWPLTFQVVVPRSEEDSRPQIRWWNRAFLARSRPLRIKLTLEDIEGEESSLVLEYVFSPFPLEKPKEDELAFFHFDDPFLLERRCIRVTKASSESGVVNIGGNDLDVHRLYKTVYHALKTGETEVDLSIGQEKGSGDDGWNWGAWALVDTNCRQVYAFKILLKQSPEVKNQMYACLGYVMCPVYGKRYSGKETRIIRYASEKVKLPPLKPFPTPEYATDDTVDDVVPDPPKPAVVPAGITAGETSTSSSQIVISQELNQRLTSIDSSLLRIAAALEQVVGVLAKK